MILAAEAARGSAVPANNLRYLLVCLFALAFAVAACDGWERGTWRFGGRVMGTGYQVTVVQPPPGLSRETAKAAVAESLQRADRLLSTYKEDSELSLFNRASAGTWVSVSTLTAEVAAISLAVSGQTGGRFDPTVAPLVDLWGFGPGGTPSVVPSEEAITRALDQVGYHHLEVRRQPPALRKGRPGLRLDFSAVAKGYGADLAAERLGALGVKNFLVEVGGEIRVAGHSPRGGGWHIGVELPDAARGVALRTLVLEGAVALATSGDYRNFFEMDGRRYAHIIDPISGGASFSGPASVTVVAQQAARADALATALLLMPPQEGLAFAEERGLAVLLLLREEGGFSVRSSSAFAPYLE